MQTLRIFLALYLFAITHSLAQSVTLKDAREAPTPIAIQAFVTTSPELSKVAIELEAALTADLIFSRIFKVLPSEAFLEPQVKGSIQTFQVDSWRQVGAQYLVRARISKDPNGLHILEGFVFDIVKGRLVMQRSYRTKRDELTALSHEFGDDIVEIVTGRKGLFSTKIAFSYVPPRKRLKEIWVMDFNGRNARPLVINDRTNISPTWSVDGRSIFYSASSTIDWHLWRTDLGGKSSQVTKFKGSALGPAAMPNGKELLISLSKDGNQDIYLIGIDGKTSRRLTAKRGINVAPFPSPDGKHLCYSSDRLGNLHVFKMNIETGEETRLTRVGTLNDSCVWAPLDNLILFSGMDTDREFDIFAMNDSGENMERLTYDAKNNETPAFSPDGKLVVFSSKRSGKNQIYIMKTDGTQETMIEMDGDATMPAWSPRLGY